MLRVGKLARAGRPLRLRATAIPVAPGSLKAQLWDEVCRLDLGADRPGSGGYAAPLPSLGSLLGQATEAIGTLSKSIGTITVASAGTVDISGSLSQSIGTIGRSLAGGVAVVGYLGNAGEASIGTITLVAVGGIGQVGSLDQPIGTITVVAAGTVEVAGVLSKSIGAVTLATTGGPEVVGTTSKSIGSILLAGSGQVDSGIASTEAPAPLPSLSLVMYQTNTIVGALNKPIGSITVVAAGYIPPDELPAFDFNDEAPQAPAYYPWARDVAWIQVDTTNRADVGGITGVVGTTIAAITSSSAGTVDVVGTLTNTLGAVVLEGDATVETGGTLNKTIGTITVVSAGDVSSSFVGNLNRDLGIITLVTTGGPVVGAELARAIGNITINADAEVTGGDYIASLNRSIGNITLDGEAAVALLGSLASTIDPIIVTGVGSVLDGTVAVLNTGIGAIALDAVGEVTVYELGVRRRRKAHATERRIGSRQARATEREIEGALIE
jgi:hypothetical protein